MPGHAEDVHSILPGEYENVVEELTGIHSNTIITQLFHPFALMHQRMDLEIRYEDSLVH